MPCSIPSLILLERQQDLLNSILSDHHHLQAITNLNVPLHSTIKRILDQNLNIPPRQWVLLPLLQRMALSAAWYVLILEVDLIVKERHDQTCGGTTSTAHLPFVTAHRIVTVDGALSLLVEAAEDGIGVVGEETLAIEDSRQAFSAGVDGHGLAVAVTVHLADGIEALLQGLAIGSEATYRQHDGGVMLVCRASTDLEDLGIVTSIDAVTGGVTSVAGHDGEVGACDGEDGAAVVGVSVDKRGQ